MATKPPPRPAKPPSPPAQFNYEVRPSGDLLTTDPNTLLRTYRNFQQLPYEVGTNPSKHEHAQFNLDHCPRIDPGAMLLLLHTGHQLRKRGCTAWARGTSGAMMMIHENMNHYLLPKEQREKKRASWPVPRVGVYFLRGVKRAEMVDELAEWADTVREGSNVSEEQVALWQMQIAEVTTNGFQHGPRLQGQPIREILIAGLAYPETNSVQLAALDYGSSIPRVLLDAACTPPTFRGDGDLITHACKKGVTSRCVVQNQGAGLHSLVKTVRSNAGGSMIILSNNGMSHVNNRGQFSRNLKPLPNGDPILSGTLTVINLQTS